MPHALEGSHCISCNAAPNLRLLVHDGTTLVIWALVCADHLDELLDATDVPFEDPDCEVRVRLLPERYRGE